MEGGGVGLLFSLLPVSLIPSPGGDPVSSSRLRFALLLLCRRDSRRPQVKGEAGTDPCFPLPIPRAGCRILVAIPARSCFVAGFGLGGSGIACWMLAAESGPLFISGGVVLSLSPSATEAGARISTGCCGLPRAAAGVGALPGERGAWGKVWAPRVGQRSDEVCQAQSWTVEDRGFSHGFIVWCLHLPCAPSGSSSVLGLALQGRKEMMLGVGGTQRACGVFWGGMYTLGSTKCPRQMPHPQEVFLEDAVLASCTQWF